MKRLGSMILAVAVATGLSVTAALAEQAASRPKLIAPVRGVAVVEITAPNTNLKGGAEIITTIRVKNVSGGPIAGFKVEENWYKGQDPVGGDSYRHPRPLQPNEVIDITLKTPRARIIGARNQYQFSHANGEIKAKTVPKIDAPAPA